MEDRKKTLRDLEAKKVETHEVMNRFLENLGGSLMARVESGGQGLDFTEQSATEKANPHLLWEEKQRLNKEIADTEEKIKAIEADLSRLGEIEGEISRKESESTEKTKEISQMNATLGRLILEDPHFDHFSVSYRQQTEDLFLQIDSQEKRLNELENAEGNFFARLANGARGWITKSQLARNEAALKGLYRSAGEQFLRTRTQDDPSARDNSPEIFDDSSWEEEIAGEVQKAEELQKSQVSLKDDISRLLTERREIADSLNKEGNPVRRISGLEKFISRNKEEIRVVHRRFGACIREDEWKEHFVPLLSEDDKGLEEKIKSLEESLKETEDRIEATKIAIAIDNENAEIEKLKKNIEDKRQRIAEAEAVIAELQGKIEAAEKHITELQGGNDQEQQN